LSIRTLLVQRDLVLLLGQVTAGGGGVAVGVGDRLALDPDLLTAHRHRLLDVLGDDVLAQPCPAGLALGRPHAELLLRARHRVIGRRAAGVAPDHAGLSAAVRLVVAPRRARAAFGQPAVRARLAVVDSVVLVQVALLVLGELAVGVDLGGVLDLVLAVGRRHLLAVAASVLERHERGLAAEHPGVDQRPLRPLGL